MNGNRNITAERRGAHLPVEAFGRKGVALLLACAACFAAMMLMLAMPSSALADDDGAKADNGQASAEPVCYAYFEVQEDAARADVGYYGKHGTIVIQKERRAEAASDSYIELGSVRGPVDSPEELPWFEVLYPYGEGHSGVGRIVVEEGVQPTSTAHWFEQPKQLVRNDWALPEIDLSAMDASLLEDAHDMFFNCPARKVVLPKGGMPKLRNAFGMFQNCIQLETVENANKIDNGSIEDARLMFNGCEEKLQTIEFSVKALSVSDPVALVWSMTGKKSALSDLDLEPFDDGDYLSMEYLRARSNNAVQHKPYQDALAQLSADGTLTIALTEDELEGEGERYSINGFSTGSAGTLRADEYGFVAPYAAEEVPWHAHRSEIKRVVVKSIGGGANTSNWFYGCRNLESVDLSGFAGTDVFGADNMFRNCTSLRSLDLSMFSTKLATSMKRMFHGCTALEQITIGSKFSFRGSQFMRLPGSELPDGAWQPLEQLVEFEGLANADDADSAAEDAPRPFAFAPDSVPSVLACSYKKVDASAEGVPVVSVYEDRNASANFIETTTLVTQEDGSVEVLLDYTVSDSYAQDEFSIGEHPKASRTLSGEEVRDVTLSSIKGSVTKVTIGSPVRRIRSRAFSAAPNVRTLLVKSPWLTTSASLNGCLSGSNVRKVQIPKNLRNRKDVKKAFAKYAGKKASIAYVGKS